MIVDGDLDVNFNVDTHATHLIRWLEKYDDVDPGLADACVVRPAEITPRAEVLTTDRRDFSVYRTLSGKTIRCIFPSVG